MSRRYYHDPDDGISTPIMLVLLALILGGWWGVVHVMDWMILDVIPWWAEPFTIVPALFLFEVRMKYGFNPLHWWPLVWGVRIKIPDDITFHMHLNYDSEKFLKKYGGLKNVFVDYDLDLIVFRRRKDAVSFCLLHIAL